MGGWDTIVYLTNGIEIFSVENCKAVYQLPNQEITGKINLDKIHPKHLAVLNSGGELIGTFYFTSKSVEPYAAFGVFIENFKGTINGGIQQIVYNELPNINSMKELEVMPYIYTDAGVSNCHWFHDKYLKKLDLLADINTRVLLWQLINPNEVNFVTTIIKNEDNKLYIVAEALDSDLIGSIQKLQKIENISTADFDKNLRIVEELYTTLHKNFSTYEIVELKKELSLPVKNTLITTPHETPLIDKAKGTYYVKKIIR